MGTPPGADQTTERDLLKMLLHLKTKRTYTISITMATFNTGLTVLLFGYLLQDVSFFCGRVFLMVSCSGLKII